MALEDVDIEPIKNAASEIERIENLSDTERLEKTGTIHTVEVNNYHGLTIECVLVYIVRSHMPMLSFDAILTEFRLLSSWDLPR